MNVYELLGEAQISITDLHAVEDSYPVDKRYMAEITFGVGCECGCGKGARCYPGFGASEDEAVERATKYLNKAGYVLQ